MERKTPLRIALFVVGEPGTGKTSAVRHLLEPGSSLNLKPKWTIGRGVVAAGTYDGSKFDGADMVPYNGVNEALAFWESALSRSPLTIFDGDRFSNRKVVTWFANHGVLPFCVHLAGSDVAADRRVKRGTNQNETWVKGRRTKSVNFADLPEFRGFRRDIEIAPTLLPEDVAITIRGLLPT